MRSVAVFLTVADEVFSLTETLIDASGHVREADGRPLSNAAVSLGSATPSGMPRDVTVVTNAAGALAVRLPPGVWYARQGGRELGLVSLLDTTRPPPPFDLRAAPTEEAACTILTSTGAPAVGARVRWRYHRRTLFEGAADADGVARREIKQLARLLALTFGGPTEEPPLAAELEAAWNAETGRTHFVSGGRPCVVRLEPAVDVTIRAPIGGMAWVRVPTGIGEGSTVIWYSGATRIPLPLGTHDLEFGSALGMAHRRITLSGPTTIVAE